MKRLLSALIALVIAVPFMIFDSFAVLTEQQRANNEKYIYDFLKSELDLNDAEACGVLANIYGESRFDPEAYCIDVDGYPSYGLCQWHVSRLTALYDFCNANNYDSASVEGQMQYLKHELNTTEKYAYTMILGIPNNEDGAYTAGYNWCRYFGRGASSLYEYRGNLSKTKFWPVYGGSSSQTVYATISAGTYYLSNNSNGKYLTVPSHEEKNGSDVALATGAENDYFRIVISADTYGYILKPKFTASSVVNIYAELVADGKNVTLYKPTGSNSQAWYFDAVDGGYVIRSVQKEELVLDVSSSGSVIVKTYVSGKASQIWSLIPADMPEAVTPTVSATGDIYKTVISWPAAARADSYTVTIYNAATGGVVISDTVTSTGYETQLAAGSYSVRVDSRNSQNNLTASGGSVAFTVEHIHVHDFSGRVEVISESTCTEHGQQRIYCAAGDGCSESITVETELKPHEFKTVFVPPTPNSNGTLAKICMKCNLFTVELDIPATGKTDPLIKIDDGEIVSGGSSRIKVKLCNFGDVGSGSFRLDFNEKLEVTSVANVSGVKNVVINDGTISFAMKDGVENAEIILNVTADREASGKLFMTVLYDAGAITDKSGSAVYPGISGGTATAILPENFYGDANRDGDVNIKDVLLIRRYIAGLIEDDALDLERADVDRNRSCDIKDVLRIRRFIAGLDDSLA